MSCHRLVPLLALSFLAVHPAAPLAAETPSPAASELAHAPALPTTPQIQSLAATRSTGTDSNRGPAVQSLAEAVGWLEIKARRLIKASRREMPNGVAAFPPQAGAGYEAFWLRDYAYMLEGCVDDFSGKELTDSCRVFIDALRADGAGVDCVKFSGQPIYSPVNRI